MRTPTIVLAERLRRCRERLGITQSEASRRAGMVPRLWHGYENGKSASLDMAHRLATAIGADPHEIDPRLAPASAGRTLTLVFAGPDPERPALAGDTPADDELLRELLTVPVGPSNVCRLIQTAGEARVRLVIRSDLAPRVFHPEPDEPPNTVKGGTKSARPGTVARRPKGR